MISLIVSSKLGNFNPTENFKLSDFEKIDAALKSGKIRINIKAVSCVFKVLLKILKQLEGDLRALVTSIQQGITFAFVRTFIVHLLQMELFEIHIYGAILADENMVFY